MRWRRWLPIVLAKIGKANVTQESGEIRVEKPYDMRRLSYAGTFTNPLKSGTIRALEWMTAKVTLLRLIRKFEASGAPFGAPFWPKAIRTMGIDIQTPEEEIARIPATGPVVLVANHPHGLVDGMVMAEIVTRVRSDFKILTRSLLTGIPEIEEFMIPVPFPHEENARELGLKMRNDTMAHLKNGGLIILFPAGKVAMSEGWWGPAIEAEWNVFTAKMIRTSGATVLPVYFPGSNSRAYQMANRISPTLRQGLLLHEVVRAMDHPQGPMIGTPIPPAEVSARIADPRAFMAWLRQTVLAIRDR